MLARHLTTPAALLWGPVALLIGLGVSVSAAQEPINTISNSRVLKVNSAQDRITSPVVSAVGISHDGRYVVTAGDDQRVRVWSVVDGRVLLELPGHQGWVRTAAFDPQGGQLATAGDDKQIIIWDLSDGKVIRRIDQLSGAVRRLDFSSDGLLLVATGFGGKLLVIDNNTGEEVRTLDCPCRDMHALVCSPDGIHAAGGGRNGNIQIWNVQTGETVLRFKGDERRIRDLAYNADGTQLASVGDSGLVHVFDTTSGEVLGEMATTTAGLRSVAFCGNGRVATGGTDNRIIIWDVATAQPVAELQGHLGTVAVLACSPTGDLLASGSFDTTVRLWNLSGDLSVVRNPNGGSETR